MVQMDGSVAGSLTLGTALSQSSARWSGIGTGPFQVEDVLKINPQNLLPVSGDTGRSLQHSQRQ